MEAFEFMDPRRRRRHQIQLAIGYVLVAIALLLISTILLFVAYGFGLKNGQVIQSGLVFLSSTPNPGQIYIDGARYQNDTNARMVLPEGTYQVALKRSGYRDWNRSITVRGGTVTSFSYPLFIPDNLTTSTVRGYTAAPALVSQSGDGRWLLVARPASLTSYDLYDLNDIKKEPVVMAVPADIFSGTATSQTLTAVAWADDNTHLLVRHVYDAHTEYVLFDRSAPEKSVNLTKQFNLPTADIELTLQNGKYDHYWMFNKATHEVLRASTGAAPTVYVSNVLTYAPYNDDTVVYDAPDPSDQSKVDVNLFDGHATYLIRRDKTSSLYLLSITNYSGNVYVATSSADQGVAYVYKNPVSQLSNDQLGVAVPVQVLRISSPTYVAFSWNSQYVLFESGSRLATYDAENDQAYDYALPSPPDAPQTHVAWMDGARIAYVSGGQIVTFDYDGLNRQTLVSADPRYDLAFAQSFKYLYNFAPSASDKTQALLTRTPLRVPADL